MGYIAVQSGNDCIYSGSTDQKEVALLATKAEKARRSITKSFAQTGRTGGGTNGTDGGDGDSTGGGTSSTSGGPGGGGGGGNPGGGNPGGGGNLSPVPLPATLPLLAIAVAGLASLRRRKPETA